MPKKKVEVLPFDVKTPGVRVYHINVPKKVEKKIMNEIDSFFAKAGSQHKRGGAKKDRPLKGDPIDIDDEQKMASGGPNSERRWASVMDTTFYGVSSTFDNIPAGIYKASVANGIGYILIKQIIETDNLLELPDSDTEEIINEFNTFWKIGDKFKERGFIRKRGFLLWGPPGSGKTSCVHILVNKLKKDYDGVVVFIDDPDHASGALQMLRKIEPERPIIVIMEDLDALIEKYGESEYLALLDGEAQVDNVVFLGTTNYPERLDLRFVDRPSRFDTIKYIGMPTPEARRAYLKIKEPKISDKELDDWVFRTEGFSIAHLKELIIAVKCFDQDIDKVVERLDKMHARKPASSDFKEGSFGFLAGISKEEMKDRRAEADELEQEDKE